MKYPKLRELKEAIKALIKGPVTTKYPFEPHIPPESFRGRPQPSQEGCIGCGACSEICPTGAIKLRDEVSNEYSVVSNQEMNTKRIPDSSLLATRYLIWHYDECIFCGQCARNCTTKNEKIPGVVMTQEFDLATTNRDTLKSQEIKHELVVCSYCNNIMTTKVHLLYVINKLGHKTFGNINLIQIISQKFFYFMKYVKFKQFNQREYIYEILCPKCRRRILLFDEYGKL
ncbi:MAG: 4Fe-4S binding protein [Endomicrobia bacterium]|nr:4Fe-4S binding protein [Endomicrobiia bacterium]